MPVLPALQGLLDVVNANPAPPQHDSVAAARDAAHESMAMSFGMTAEPGPPVKEQRDVAVPVEGGEITIRLYYPEAEAPLPGYVYFHGGGFWLGNLEMSDDACRAVAVEAGCVVASVDYRLAPEAKFPIPAEDSYAALLFVAAHAADLGIDPTRLAVGGASAGGNLAAVVALLARDRSGPALRGQVLEIPVTDLTMGQPSIDENGEGLLLTRRSIEQYTAYYLADPADATNPYASPLLADDLTGLPPAIVLTAEYDPLRDEGEAYARRLAEAGVPVELIREDGQFHGSYSMSKLIPAEATAHRDAVVRFLKNSLT